LAEIPYEELVRELGADVLREVFGFDSDSDGELGPNEEGSAHDKATSSSNSNDGNSNSNSGDHRPSLQPRLQLNVEMPFT
ncbi:hypothetical protein EV182_005672, partial [Spiromyces aspiralis]